MKPFMIQSAGPLEIRSDSGRIRGYDLARGIAILAMVVINSKTVFSHNDTLPLWLCRGIDLMDRRAAVLLVMVAGAGITLLSGKTGRTVRHILAQRAVFLFLAGTLLSLIWDADILHFYGVFLLIGICCFRRSDRVLLSCAGLFWLGGVLPHLEPVAVFLYDLEPGDPAWYTADLLLSGFYPVFPWAVFFLAGMWLGRRDLRNPASIMKMLAAGFLMVAAVPLLSCFFYIDSDLRVPTPWSVLSGLGTGMCGIALSMHWSAVPNRPWAAWLATAGRNTMTLYVTHILLMRAVGLIPGVPDHFGILWVFGGAVLFFIIYLGLIRYWLERHARGPLETLMRQFPFFRKTRVSETGPLTSHTHAA